MVAPIRYLSRREQQQKIGILSSTEDEKVLEVVGRVGIGTTIFDAEVQLDVRGTTNISGSLGIGTTNPTSEVHVSGVGTTANVDKTTLQSMVPNGGPRVRVGSHHWDEIFTSIHTKDVTSEIWVEQNSDNDDGADLCFYKSRGVPGAETPVLLGDNIGRINVRGFSTTATTSGAGITLGDYPNKGGSLEWNVDFIGTNPQGRGYPAASFNVKGQDVIRFTVASAGNVGIGTTNPQAPLHLQHNNPRIFLSDKNQAVDHKHWQIGAGVSERLRIQALNDNYGGGSQYFDFVRHFGNIEEFRGTKSGQPWFVIHNNLQKVGIGSTVPTAKLDVDGTVNVTGIATFSDNVSIANTENKTYPPTGSSWNVSVGLDQYLEVGGTQVVNSNGIKRVSGIRNRLIKNNDNTQDISLLHHNGIDQSFIWSDQNTCNDYESIKDDFIYFGHDANGETSSSFEAGYINLVPGDGETQTIYNTKSDERTLQLRAAAISGISTINITNAKGYSHRLVLLGSNTGTHNYNITNFTAFETSPNWMSAVISGTINATITNYYGLKLNPPSATTGLTITNNYGVYSGWSSSTNYFAGVVGIGSTTPTAKLDVAGSFNVTGVSTFRNNINLVSAGNTSTITGPSNLILDPAAIGDNTGKVIVLGDLQVDGTQTTIHSTTLEVDDKLISIAKSATNATQANGAGLDINGANATLTYAYSDDRMVFNKDLQAPKFYGDGSGLTGIGVSQVVGGVSGSLIGDASGSTTYYISATNATTGISSNTYVKSNIVLKDSKVGIGTNNPTAKLDVAGIVSATSFSGDGSNLTGIGISQIVNGISGSLIGDASGSTTYYISATNATTGISSNTYVKSNIVLKNNKVGIGTNNPTAKLDVVGSFNVTGVSTINNTIGNLKVINSADNKDISLFTRKNTDPAGIVSTAIRAVGSTGEVELYHSGVSKLTTKSTGIDVTGRTETDLLNVSGVSTFAGAIDANGGLDVSGGVLTANNNINTYSVRYASSSNTRLAFDASNEISLRTGSGTILKVKGDKVGIGTTNPLVALDVVGSIREELHTPAMSVGLNEDIGVNWTKVEMGSTLERVLSLVYCGDGIVLAGTGSNENDGDVYRSTDYGVTWIKVEMGATLDGIGALVYCGNGIVLAVSNDNTFNAGGGDAYRSTDFGKSFTKIELGNNLHSLWSLDYCGNGIVVAGAGQYNDEGDIYRSTDFGATFTKIEMGSDLNSIFAVKYCGNGIVLAGSGFSTGEGDIYRSTDYGATYTKIEMGADLESIYAIEYCGNGIVLAGSGLSAGDGDIYRSTDYGVTYTKIEMGAGLEAIYAIEYCGNGIVLAGSALDTGDGDIYKSTDYGLTWTKIEMGGSLKSIRSIVHLNNGIVLAGSGSATGAGDIYRSEVGFSQATSLQGVYHEHLTGNVGIGSTQPTAKLDIVGGVNASGIITATESDIAFFTTKNYSRSWPYADWSNSQPGVTLQSISRNVIIQAGGAQTTRSYFSLTNGGGAWIGGGTGSTEGVNIEAGAGDVKITGGNVGIGITNATAKLDVDGTLNVSGISTFAGHINANGNIVGDNSTNISGINSVTATSLEINVGTGNSALDIQGSAGQLFSVTNNLTSGSIFSVNDVSGIPSIDVDADGTIQLAPFGATEFVGIGSTNPTAKLDVAGNVSIAGTLTVGNSPYVTSPGHLIREVGHLVTRRDGAKAPVYSAYDGEFFQNNIKIQFENDGSAFFMNSVGIGTTNPQFDLDIGGYEQATSPKTAGVGTVRIASTLGIGVTDFTRTGAFPLSNNYGGVLTLGGDYSTGDNPVIIFDSHPSSTSFVNVLIGSDETGRNMTNQSGNVYIGGHAGRLNTGSNNIAIGPQALTSAGGSYVYAIGYRAGTEGTGQNNICIGKNAGSTYDTAAANNIFLGHNAGGAGGGNYDNNILIGSGAGNADFRPAKGADDQLAIGFRSSSFQPEKYWIVGDENQNIGIGTTTPNNYTNYKTLTINGTTGAEIDFESNGTLIGDIFGNASGLFMQTRTEDPIVFSTFNGSSLIERLRIAPAGQLGIGGTNYGTAGQVMKSNGPSAAPTWSNLYSMYFYGEQDTQHNVAHATYTKLINLGFNSISIGATTVAAFDESAGEVTIGADGAGYYYLEMYAGIDDIQAGDYCQVVIGKNGDSTDVGTRLSSYGRGWASNNNNQVVTAHISCIANLGVGDVVRFYVYHNEGSTEPTEPNRCSVLGYKI